MPQVRWRPFFLNPSAPIEGVNKRAMYEEKFGAARVNQMLPMMTEVKKASRKLVYVSARFLHRFIVFLPGGAMLIFCGLVVSVAILSELARYRRMCTKRSKL